MQWKCISLGGKELNSRALLTQFVNQVPLEYLNIESEAINLALHGIGALSSTAFWQSEQMGALTLLDVK